MTRIEQKPGEVTFGSAVGDFFKGYFDFKGRTTRAGFWWVNLAVMPLAFVLGLLLAAVSLVAEIGVLLSIVTMFVLLLFLAIFIPLIALQVRRYRDAGLNGKGFLVIWLLSMVLNMLGLQLLSWPFSLGLFILTVLPTDKVAVKSSNEFVRFFLREKQ